MFSVRGSSMGSALPADTEAFDTLESVYRGSFVAFRPRRDPSPNQPGLAVSGQVVANCQGQANPL